MYNIDLSFLKGSIVECDPKSFELKYNNIYKDFIVKNCIHCEEQEAEVNVDFIFESRNINNKDIILANCKGLLGEHYCKVENINNIKLDKGDIVIVEHEGNQEISEIKEVGNIVCWFRLHEEEDNCVLPKVIRKIRDEDLKKYDQNISDEIRAYPIFRNLAKKLSLEMKLVDIHFQFDRKKLFFFYTADGRVDFRELAKNLASEFKTRIELRQIGVRDEAKRIGGLGTCGREYCCATFLNTFKRISTQLATDQNLSTNMAKLSGPCGKLKCCLSFDVQEES
ncbi:MAG: hypothetical protein K9J16_02645 [Melioribacteraceae bacterium]|nr:hypothetical protein [Melioribacteraceae bacterium]MCF8352906.1 hypothetical protein [Melioribacteraceae bacterium]MCF8393777.1 hypothetical protein [Melioribacteraceae bacterium]MCF8417423.1 hypothetical protein [Melioribacteraceae bacterium]